MTSKIIVLGGVNCQLQAAFTKLAKLQAKQNFAFAIIVGDLFGDCSTENQLDEISALLHGNIGVPLPTYFTVGDLPLPTRIVEKIEADDEVCPNLYFLGKRGSLKTSEGVRIAALGGTLASGDSHKPESNASGKFQTTYSEADARALFGTHSADILITNQWPKGIRTGSKVSTPEDQSTLPTEVQCVADICATLKPKYHFSPSDAFFYEREPFFHMPTEDNPNAKPLTRFISMASFSSKQKAMYAFTLDPKAEAPLTLPAGATASPLSAPQSKRKALAPQRESFHRFAMTDDDNRNHSHKRHRRDRAPPPGPEQCFFCLSNPNIATHLITSIGDESYLTIAKGPLPTKDFFPSLGFPGHMLIIPFTHSPTLASIQETESRASTYKEMQRYRSSLHKMIMDRSEGKLGAVTWEVSRSGGIHTHWQFLPVPINLISDGLVDAAFKVEAENLKYPRFTTLPASESKGADEAGDFFRLWIWNADDSTEGAEKMLMLDLSQDFRFDLQFGRRVMAKLLELDQRMYWKDAPQTEAEEEADAVAFKAAFEKYDFSLEAAT
ncbi:CwfJ C-terminus 2-domain-containing protein-like protein [Penicillium herquei]|nr:CwfJ C-terminus 2-domain-containing protein-like protein [Penicillium herquei]